ncbi:MAG: anti-sigma factor antagonist [Selenomonadaceae bacterium]|nr:anti-sigma factor antagonist [Selenomonadaceae bacterium]
MFNDGTLEERKRFIENCGFSVKNFFYTDKVKVIPSLQDNPALMQRLLSAYKDKEFMVWILTAEATNATEKQKLNIPFSQKISLEGDVLSINISGRLDTITAPKLLQKYEEERTKYTVKEIRVNAAELEFISYAGLRVLKIMRDFLEDKSLFKIDNADCEIGNILKENGF